MICVFIRHGSEYSKIARSCRSSTNFSYSSAGNFKLTLGGESAGVGRTEDRVRKGFISDVLETIN